MISLCTHMKPKFEPANIFFLLQIIFFSDSKMSHNTRSSPAGSPIKRPRLTSPVKPRGGGNVGVVVGTEYLSPLKTGSSARDLLSGKLFFQMKYQLKNQSIFQIILLSI